MTGQVVAAGRLSLSFPADHPMFAGHFPAAPIVPGVLLLDAALHAIETTAAATGGPPLRPGMALHRVGAVKFFRTVGPGEALSLRWTSGPDGSVHFEWSSGVERVASGSIERQESGDSEHQ